jgi:hypothetical protein
MELDGDDGAKAEGGGVGDDGTVGDGCTAPDPQAAVANMTEIPTSTSLIRDPVRPKVEISMSTSVALLA